MTITLIVLAGLAVGVGAWAVLRTFGDGFPDTQLDGYTPAWLRSGEEERSPWEGEA